MSRCYYAAFSIAVWELEGNVSFPRGRGASSHAILPDLVRQYLSRVGVAQRREIAASLRRLYGARLVADYRSRLTLDEATARAGLTDVVRVYRLLGVDYAE